MQQPATERISTLHVQTLKWLVNALLCYLAVACIIGLVLIVSGEDLDQAFSATGLGYNVRNGILGSIASVGDDSWKRMLLAYNHKLSETGGNLYDIFFKEHVKFQYPPMALLPLDLIPRSFTVLDGNRINDVLAWRLYRLTWWVLVLTIIVSIACLEIRLSQLSTNSRQPRFVVSRVIVATALGFLYYPLLKAHTLGQVQVFVNCLLSFAVLFFLLGYRMLSGLCVGVCCLLKPQYGVVALWALFGRQWSFAAGLFPVVMVGCVVSVIRFGIWDHVQYLQVLQSLSHGEVFWPNQSMNGLVNRFVGNGDPVHWSNYTFPPFDLAVYATTLTTSFLILALAVWPGYHKSGSPRRLGSVADLMVVLVAATIASPIAWEHHYGAFLAMFAAVLPDLILVRPFGRLTGAVAMLSFVACASAFLRPEMIFSNRWFGLIGSHLFLGATLFIAMLFVLRARQEYADESSQLATVHGSNQTKALRSSVEVRTVNRDVTVHSGRVLEE